MSTPATTRSVPPPVAADAAPSHRPRRAAISTLTVLSIALALVPLGAIAATLAWTFVAHRHTAVELRRRQADQTALALAESARVLLKSGDADPLRTALKHLSEGASLETCSITLADGTVVAHSDPARITHRSLPESWPKGPAAATAPAFLDGAAIEARRAVDLGDGATALVTVRTALPNNRSVTLGLVAPLGLIALGSIVGVAFIVHRACRLLRPLQAIQGAMHAIASGEKEIDALTITPRWGVEAAAWNAFLASRQSESDADLDRQVTGAGAAGRSGDGLIERACDALPQGVLILDAAGKVRYANGAAGALLGRDRRELLGKPMAALADDQRLIATVRAVAEQGLRRRGSVEISKGEGDESSVLRFTCCRAAPTAPDANASPDTPGGSAGPSIVFVEDLTQQRIADKSRDSFVANAAHELRTPLTNIRLYLETLLEGGDKDAKTRGDCINVINQEARRLERMVGDMLSVSEIEAGSLKLHTDDVRLDQLLKELEADYQAQAAGKKITLAFDLPPKLPVLRGDRDKIAMSLHNLIGNALKYTPDGGAVTVTVEETPTSVAVRVKDSGIGISADEAERIFEKFYRSKDRRIAKITGTGLGLSIAREVVRLHGGDITVDSQLDQGSTFTLTLPHLAQAA